MTKEQFIELLRELNGQVPDQSIKKAFLQNKALQYGLSLDQFYTALNWFYLELKKLQSKEVSSYIGTTTIVDNYIGFIMGGSCVLKMNIDTFNNLPKLFSDAKQIGETPEPLEDYSYYIKWFKDRQNEKMHFFQQWKDEIKTNGYFGIFDKDESLKLEIYTPQLFQILRCDKIEAHNQQLNTDVVINGHDYYKTFVKAYKEGLKTFETDYEVKPSILFGDNAKEIITNLDNQYNENWKFVKTFYPLDVSHSIIKRYGFYSGMVARLTIFLNKYPSIFDKFELTASSKEAQTTPKYPIIDQTKYNSDLIYKTFANGLLFKCSKEVFNSWFVIGVGHTEHPKINKNITAPIGQTKRLIDFMTSTEVAKQKYFKDVFNEDIETYQYQKTKFAYTTELKACEK